MTSFTLIRALPDSDTLPSKTPLTVLAGNFSACAKTFSTAAGSAVQAGATMMRCVAPGIRCTLCAWLSRRTQAGDGWASASRQKLLKLRRPMS